MLPHKTGVNGDCMAGAAVSADVAEPCASAARQLLYASTSVLRGHWFPPDKPDTAVLSGVVLANAAVRFARPKFLEILVSARLAQQRVFEDIGAEGFADSLSHIA
jgi:hypothetical protein